MKRPQLAPFAVLATLAAIAAPGARATKSHVFTATYRGHGSGSAIGNSASGSATATGRGKLIGRSTLSGSASGVLTSARCVLFSGRVVLRGSVGSLRLSTTRATACVSDTSADNVAFSGHARVTGGTLVFARATGTLSFRGTYDKQSGSVTISFSGRLVY